MVNAPKRNIFKNAVPTPYVICLVSFCKFEVNCNFCIKIPQAKFILLYFSRYYLIIMILSFQQLIGCYFELETIQ